MCIVGNIDNFLSLGYFNGYDASLGPFCISLVDKPKEIMWNTFINFSFDFSMALALLKRVLILFLVIILMLSYNRACEPYVEEFDKLLQALTMSDPRSQFLRK